MNFKRASIVAAVVATSLGAMLGGTGAANAAGSYVMCGNGQGYFNGNPTTQNIAGWVRDPDTPQASTSVALLFKNTTTSQNFNVEIAATIYRPDPGLQSNSGFSYDASALPSGLYQVIGLVRDLQKKYNNLPCYSDMGNSLLFQIN